MFRALAPIVGLAIFVAIFVVAMMLADAFSGLTALADASESVPEDSIFWSCSTMGNGQCGPGVVFNTTLDAIFRAILGPFFRL